MRNGGGGGTTATLSKVLGTCLASPSFPTCVPLFFLSFSPSLPEDSLGNRFGSSPSFQRGVEEETRNQESKVFLPGNEKVKEKSCGQI